MNEQQASHAIIFVQSVGNDYGILHLHPQIGVFTNCLSAIPHITLVHDH